MNIKTFAIALSFVFISSLVRGQASQPYLVADFSEKDLPVMLDLCHQGGFEMLVERTPFSTYGHYVWNNAFAPEGDRSVKRMAQAAEKEGVTLGLLVQEDAISLNDMYFSPKYFRQYRRSEQLKLFEELTADEVDIALRRNETFKDQSSLNLLMIDDEIVSFGTKEFAGDLVLLHHCTRGMYDTKITSHGTDAKVFRIMDSPGRFVIPDGELLQTVRQQLADRLSAANVSTILYQGVPGQEVLDEAIRVRQVERWEQEGVTNGSLGWFMIHAADKKRAATEMEDLEWMLAKAAAYDANYALLVDPKAIKGHGSLRDLLVKAGQWGELIRGDAFTSQQKSLLKDPYLDWHLECQPDSLYIVYPWNLSRRFQCKLQEIDTGLLRGEDWVWKSEEEGPFGIRLMVDGEVEVTNPMINTNKGLVMFPCTLKPGQRLDYLFGETACVMDANLNKVSEFTVEGVAELAQGENEVYLLCEVDPSVRKFPVMTLRYITREIPFMLNPH